MCPRCQEQLTIEGMRNPVSKFFTLIAICLSACVAMKGTTVVVIWTPDHVVVGADSRVTYDAMGSKESFADNGCKIMQEGHVLYASSGFSKQFQYFLVSDSIKHATS